MLEGSNNPSPIEKQAGLRYGLTPPPATPFAVTAFQVSCLRIWSIIYYRSSSAVGAHSSYSFSGHRQPARFGHDGFSQHSGEREGQTFDLDILGCDTHGCDTHMPHGGWCDLH